MERPVLFYIDNNHVIKDEIKQEDTLGAPSFVILRNMNVTGLKRRINNEAESVNNHVISGQYAHWRENPFP